MTVLIVLLIAITQHLINVDLLKYLAFTSGIFNKWCLSGVPKETAFPFIIEGMLCGKNIESPHYRNILAQSNLLHLLVVSGSHLIFLELIFKQVIPNRNSKFWQSLILLSLFAFCLMTLMQPPVFRAFIGLLLKKENQSLGNPIADHFIVLISGLLCLLIFPNWIHSWSMILSWLAALALANINTLRVSDSLLGQAWVSAFLFLPLTRMSSPHPVGILLGSFLLIPLGLTLLPICLAVCLLPWAIPLFDASMESLVQILSTVREFYPPGASSFQLQAVSWWDWFYVIALQMISYWIARNHRRHQVQKCH